MLTGCSKTAEVAVSEKAAEIPVSAEATEPETTEPETQAPIEESTSEPIRLFLVRHGQTYSNIKEATIGGGGNAQLTVVGRQYAYSLGQGFNAEDIKFSAAYSSTLGRAHETAAQILRGNSQDLEITEYDDLKDISWGAVEGGRIEDLHGKYGFDGNDFKAYFGTFDQEGFVSPVEGAEPTHDFAQRIDGALRQIVAENEENGGNILVVGHSSLGFYLHKYRADQDMAGLTNTSTSILEYKDGEFTLVDYDNVEYLKNGREIKDSLQPLEIKLVTTPQTIFKLAEVLEGTSDSNLNETGIRQAEALREKLDMNTVSAVYSSNLNRSKKTAAIALEGSNAQIIQNEYLNELFLGYWEAEILEVLEKNEAANLKTLLSANKISDFVPPDGGGESPFIASYRLKTVLEEIGVKYQADEKTVIVFTHPLILKAYLNSMFPEFEYEVSDDMQITTLQYASEVFTLTGCETVTSE